MQHYCAAFACGGSDSNVVFVMDHLVGTATPRARVGSRRSCSSGVKDSGVRTPSHSRTEGFGSGSSVVSRKYVSTPYGGLAPKALESPRAISVSAGWKRFSTEPAVGGGKSSVLLPFVSTTKA